MQRDGEIEDGSCEPRSSACSNRLRGADEHRHSLHLGVEHRAAEPSDDVVPSARIVDAVIGRCVNLGDEAVESQSLEASIE
jgi:hypothetical protein